MTWRSCSPPWPGRQNPVSWPGRRQCGLPSAERPLRSASRPLPGGQGGAGAQASSFPSQAGHGAGRGSGWAGQRPCGLHGRTAQPHSAAGPRHGGGAGPASLWPAPVRHLGSEARQDASGSGDERLARPRAARFGEPRAGPRPGEIPAGTLPAATLPVRSSSHRTGLQPRSLALAEPAGEGIGSSQPAAILAPGALHRHPDGAGAPAHAEPVRSLTCPRPDPDRRGCIRAACPCLRSYAR